MLWIMARECPHPMLKTNGFLSHTRLKKMERRIWVNVGSMLVARVSADSHAIDWGGNCFCSQRRERRIPSIRFGLIGVRLRKSRRKSLVRLI